VSEAFFHPDGDRFEPTELTRGPWDPNAQHAGPPAALLGRAIERFEPSDGLQVGRISFDILRPVPLAPLTLQTRVVRPGRNVELLEAELSGSDGPLVRAAAWRVRTAEVELEPPPPAEEPPPGPEQGAPSPFFETGAEVGYHTATDYRFVRGGFLELGPATVWTRMLHPLVAGEEPSPLQRVLIAADSGNGVSATLDYGRYLFINTDLTVHLHRLPAGEWVCLDAVTYPEPNGVGLADTALWDERGRLGRGAQTLLVRER
jgi:acyl-Coa thioesterase superfamily protein/acyl-CoA thioesterase superfamily protein